MVEEPVKVPVKISVKKENQEVKIRVPVPAEKPKIAAESLPATSTYVNSAMIIGLQEQLQKRRANPPSVSKMYTHSKSIWFNKLGNKHMLLVFLWLYQISVP